MGTSHTEDSIDGFTLELLRAGYALTGLGAELADAIEDGVQGAYEMISGSVRAFLAESDTADVARATALMSGAMDRVLEHMELALELRRRMDEGGLSGEDGTPLQWPGTDAAEIVAELAEPASGPSGELAEALVHCGGLLSQVVAQIVRWDGRRADGDVPIPDGACRLIAALLRDLDDCFSEDEMGVATRVVEALIESLTHDIYFVDPDALEGGLGAGDPDVE